MTKNRFITGYSGLRALAVVGVILYHLAPDTFVGGYLGVPIFFVLSGYLVTCQMLKAYDENGTFDNQGFYLSRLKKLYPPLITVLWLSATYILLFQRNLLAKLSEIVFTNLLNVYNFWQILNGQSYFERFAANESPFVHLWTMSINGQFYLLWPLVIFLLVKYGKKRKKMFWLLFTFSLASAIEMAIMYYLGIDINRIYYGTDTRFFALGLGASLAVVWPIDKLKEIIRPSDIYLLDSVGLIALIGIVILFFNPLMNPQRSVPYYGGMLFFTILVVLMVAVIAHPGSHWNQLLTNPIFNWLGSRSYEIYLYQFPVMIFFEDKISDMADHVLLYHVIEIILILLFSEIAYRLIEKPFGKINWEKTKNYLQQVFNLQTSNYLIKSQAIIASLILILGSFAITISPIVKAEDFTKSQLALRIKSNRQQQEKDNQVLIAKLKKAKKKTRKKAKIIDEAKQNAIRHVVNKSYMKYYISQIDLQLAQKIELTAVGDSVMAGSSNNLTRLMPKAVIDAAVSRQANVALDLLNHYKAQNALEDNVLIGLGTNGSFPISDLDQLMKLVGSNRHVFWINTHVPDKPWQNQVNQLLIEAAKRYHNLTIIDWYNYSKNHPNWFYDDNTHPTPIGSKYYSAFIVKTIVRHAKF
ncbi:MULTISPECIES: acyltransferase family protein [unclassified Lactobacillus]|uniref:acyltransferase family protein n=1 Tax=unclassified Lactobacillus TaxID=2620435 RepID=UPI000EFA8A4F|nr:MULTISPECIES: acyltransferase family protein [unclassified Lactobacillus]RMC25149.1 acetyltransferase [Lactobacillus sp. ESL0247]RMC29303.1 acetyltransferase [Lactobacillus sp. ESL0246]RMC32324.1 acetyltransferase [Lactobacillus sp. ESL0245]RMC48740.1 acetyltransferase [Lactobacillus sp. ESL0228]